MFCHGGAEIDLNYQVIVRKPIRRDTFHGESKNGKNVYSLDAPEGTMIILLVWLDFYEN